MRPLPWPHALVALALLGVGLVAPWITRRSAEGLRLSVPALPGDGALLTTPGGRHVLIDGGADGTALVTWLGSRLPIGQRSLAALILTRADAATVPGQLAVLRRYRIGAALGAAGAEGEAATAWRERLAAQGAPVHLLDAGQHFALDDCLFTTLHAQAGRLALQARCAATQLYFLQSIDDAGAQVLAEQALEPAGAVLYPWRRAPDRALLERLQPSVIIFGEGDQGQAELSLYERRIGTARLLHEALHGQIELRDRGTGLELHLARGAEYGH
ncbi:hypothetical protein [Kallotenue papyrolyticum]|uniref:hypothetical protein n=1 Tax=Kallotenue papyrolyticum TaxID=1325125 RepID=UPI000478664C|nr:hypothetical protein [Kallotenue papyrolyticum]